MEVRWQLESHHSGMTSGGAPDTSSTLVVHIPPILSTLTGPPQVAEFKDLKSFVRNGTAPFVYELTQRQCTLSCCSIDGVTDWSIELRASVELTVFPA